MVWIASYDVQHLGRLNAERSAGRNAERVTHFAYAIRQIGFDYSRKIWSDLEEIRLTHRIAAAGVTIRMNVEPPAGQQSFFK